MSRDIFNKQKLKVVKSIEISPIKVTSHRLNTSTTKPSHCTLIEALDEEINDKENIVKTINESKKKTAKVFVNSRYKDTSNKVNPSIPKVPRTNPKNPIPKETRKETSKETRKEISLSSEKSSLADEADNIYCQYIQSAFINHQSKAALIKQESIFSDRYRLLGDELLAVEDRLVAVDTEIDTLTRMAAIRDMIDDDSAAIDRLSNSLDTSQLHRLYDTLRTINQSIELSDGAGDSETTTIEFGDVSSDDLSIIDGFASRVVEHGDVDVVDSVGRVAAMLAEVRMLAEEHSREQRTFRDRCTNYVGALLKNTRDC